MLFDSFVFAGLFLPLSLTLFWLAPSQKLKQLVLLVSSLFFYGYWNMAYLPMLIGMVFIAWLCARHAARTSSTWPVGIAAASLLGILIAFKYRLFIGDVLVDLGLMTPYRVVETHAVILPLGISFITFQALGYVIDVHRKDTPAEPRFAVVLLFKAFFPQLISGPLCRAHQLMPQVKGPFLYTRTRVVAGMAIFAIGLFLKLVFADGLASSVDALFMRPSGHSRLESWAAAYGFGSQIYADFWGYSTMAVGLAHIYGIELPINFRLPYLATSIREFWRRWHITLSQWLRDYVYKPLGGSRQGLAPTVLALVITMFLGGLWHGANYTFILWGLLHGIILSVEHVMQKVALHDNAGPAGVLHVLSRALGWGYTMFIVLIGWILFRATDVGQALSIIKSFLIGQEFGIMTPPIIQITSLAMALFILQVPVHAAIRALAEDRIPEGFSFACAFSFLLGAVVLSAPETHPFIYFQF
jgi:D-alanyl-lipoteichoic acid acyltransferase DltB (MBOAT superfamily)